MKIQLPEGVVSIVGRHALLCQCRGEACGRTFIVFDSRIGPMTCPHCTSEASAAWGTFEVVFVPELPPPGTQITKDMLAPGDLLTKPEPAASEGDGQ